MQLLHILNSLYLIYSIYVKHHMKIQPNCFASIKSEAITYISEIEWPYFCQHRNEILIIFLWHTQTGFNWIETMTVLEQSFQRKWMSYFQLHELFPLDYQNPNKIHHFNNKHLLFNLTHKSMHLMKLLLLFFATNLTVNLLIFFVFYLFLLLFS